MEDSVQIRCTRCKNVFRDRAKRLQNGYSRQCPSCEIVLFFDEDSHDANIKRAMRTARRARKELRESEGVSTRKATAARGDMAAARHRARAELKTTATIELRRELSDYPPRPTFSDARSSHWRVDSSLQPGTAKRPGGVASAGARTVAGCRA